MACPKRRGTEGFLSLDNRLSGGLSRASPSLRFTNDEVLNSMDRSPIGKRVADGARGTEVEMVLDDIHASGIMGMNLPGTNRTITYVENNAVLDATTGQIDRAASLEATANNAVHEGLHAFGIRGSFRVGLSIFEIHHMDTSISGNGREQAIHDWHARRVRHLAVGTPDIDVPTYDRTRNLFYRGGFGCAISPAEELYCQEYNRTVAWLIEKYGVPDWAPVRRLPTAVSLLESLKSAGLPFESYSAETVAEKNLVDFVLYYWQCRLPASWIRLRQSSLLVWGGDVSDDVGRIDVIDTLDEVRWMAVYQLPREEYGSLPWESGRTHPVEICGSGPADVKRTFV
jgi:hypothetical protein